MSYSTMLEEAKAAFKDRLVEVEMYFDFISKINQSNARLVYAGAADGETIIHSELRNTLMGISYVVLYNLVESTLRNFIASIYEDMVRRGIHIEDTRATIRQVVFKSFKEHMPTEFYKREMDDLSLEIIAACWNKKKLFSGNVDHKIIKKTAKCYGFKIPGWSTAYSNGEKLEEVKDNRNWLAHGEKSFRECVAVKSIDELLEVKRQVVGYLESLCKNISGYIERKEYLTVPPSHASASSPL